MPPPCSRVERTTTTTDNLNPGVHTQKLHKIDIFSLEESFSRPRCVRALFMVPKMVYDAFFLLFFLILLFTSEKR